MEADLIPGGWLLHVANLHDFTITETDEPDGLILADKMFNRIISRAVRSVKQVSDRKLVSIYDPLVACRPGSIITIFQLTLLCTGQLHPAIEPLVSVSVILERHTSVTIRSLCRVLYTTVDGCFCIYGVHCKPPKSSW